jgi:hypothetical protein
MTVHTTNLSRGYEVMIRNHNLRKCNFEKSSLARAGRFWGLVDDQLPRLTGAISPPNFFGSLSAVL